MSFLQNHEEISISMVKYQIKAYKLLDYFTLQNIRNWIITPIFLANFHNFQTRSRWKILDTIPNVERIYTTSFRYNSTTVYFITHKRMDK